MTRDERESNILNRKIVWAEIKVLERNFKRNHEGIKLLQDENTGLVKQLGDKLAKIQELAEIFDEANNVF